MKRIILLAVLCTGCASTYHQDSVDTFNAAVIESEPCKNSECLILQEIDGKWRGMGRFNRYELKPGVRTVKFVLEARYTRGSTGIVVEFYAEAGHVYSTRSNANYAAMSWMPEIIDNSTNKVVSKVIDTAFSY